MKHCPLCAIARLWRRFKVWWCGGNHRWKNLSPPHHQHQRWLCTRCGVIGLKVFDEWSATSTIAPEGTEPNKVSQL